MVTRTVAGRTFTFERADVERATAGALPEPIRDHYVVVAGRRFPPKQVLTLVTGLDRSDFTTHHARSILQRAGLVTGRASSDAPAEPTCPGWPHGGREAEELRPHAGRWVAQRGLRVLVAADDPREVARWLSVHREQADHLFRVPLDAQETDLAGPL